MDLLEQLKKLLGLHRKTAPRPRKTKKPTPSPSAAFLQLDASDLLPITREELQSSLEELIRKGDFRFAARGTIPHGDDRTRLINRALLTQGLLTPEELDQIVRIAQEHERLQKALLLIDKDVQKAGTAAVKADREARAKRKEQKKAEAAQRKQDHADAVAQRRATDIVFLGPGVSGRLGQRESEVPRLEALGLPVLATPADVAQALGLTIPRLRWLAFHTEVAKRIHYVHFTVPKRSGGTRTLSAPHGLLAAAQQWILTNILNKLPLEAPAHGFRAGHSILTNAQAHVGRAVVVNMDLEGFFPSIGFRRVRSVFQRLGYSPAVATLLALLCTECPREPVVYAGEVYYVATGPRGLPQGACTSPALSNQVARRLDKRLGGLANKMGLTYTRYADDLSFSGEAALNEKIGYLMTRVRHLAEEEGFAVNEKKSRVLRRNTAQTVTGLVVNQKPSLPRKELRRLRALLHRARTEGLDAQNREGRPNFRAWLAGKIAYVRMVRPDVGARLQAEFQALLSR